MATARVSVREEGQRNVSAPIAPFYFQKLQDMFPNYDVELGRLCLIENPLGLISQVRLFDALGVQRNPQSVAIVMFVIISIK